MKMKLAALFCFIGLGVAILCPTICAAKELSAPKQHNCCSTTSTSQNSHCSNGCSIHTQSLLPDHVHLPQLDYIYTSIIPAPVFSINITSLYSSLVTEYVRPPDHLLFLKTIRIQC